jgi:hypothetical protein
MNPRLTVELVPATAWGDNLRSRLTPARWDELRKAQYKLANYCCEICGGKGSKHPVECHEVWEYDDEKLTQKLLRLIALCPRCHRVKHAGRTITTSPRGEAEVMEWLMRVNRWGTPEAKHHLASAFDLWRTRSQFKWTLDISVLDAQG